MNIVKYTLFFLFLFLLLYLEDRISFGSISLSNLWKIGTIIILLFYLISRKKKTGLSVLDNVIILFSFSFLININTSISFLDIEEIMLTLILPISYYSFYYLYRLNDFKLKKDLLLFAVFLVISGIPFFLEIIKPYSDFTASRLDFAESYQLNSRMLVGFFKQPSLSSKVFVFATAFTWMFGVRDKENKKVFRIILFLIFLVGIYEVYLAFTRTGWFMLVLFFIVFLFFNTNYSKSKKIIVSGIIICGLGLTYSLSEVIQNRITGERVNGPVQTSAISKISSGRNVIMVNAFETVFQEGDFAILFGLGREYAVKKNNGALAHNRFIEIFQYGGLISLFLYCLYLLFLLKEIRKYRSNDDIYFFCITLYLIMGFSLIPSHGLPIWADVLFGGAIALNRINCEKKYLNQNFKLT